MNLHIRGADIPEALLETFAAITDHAKLRCAQVAYDDSSGTVELPITRLPLVKQRRVLGNRHDPRNPIQSTVTVRNVISCKITDNTPAELEGQVMLLFGIGVRGEEVFAYSAEEDRGSSCFSVTMQVADLDIELDDELQ